MKVKLKSMHLYNFVGILIFNLAIVLTRTTIPESMCLTV